MKKFIFIMTIVLISITYMNVYATLPFAPGIRNGNVAAYKAYFDSLFNNGISYPDTGQYGYVIKWNHNKMKWTAQEDSIGEAAMIVIEDSTAKAIHDSIAFAHLIRLWADNDSVLVNNLRKWAESDSVKINLLRLFAEADSVKINNLRKWAETDSVKINLLRLFAEADSVKINNLRKWAESDSVALNLLRNWAADDSILVNSLRLWAESDSVKINNLRKWAETDSAHYNTAWITALLALPKADFPDSAAAAFSRDMLMQRRSAMDDSINAWLARTLFDSSNVKDASLSFSDLSKSGGSYGKIFKWNPTTSLWSAQEDSFAVVEAGGLAYVDSTNIIDGSISNADIRSDLTTKWTVAHTRVAADSANWNTAYVRIEADSSNWNTSYVRVKADSANWNTGYIKGSAALPKANFVDSLYANVPKQFFNIASLAIPDTVSAPSDSLNAIALSDSTLPSEYATYLNTYGNNSVSVAKGYFIMPFVPQKLAPDSLCFWIKSNAVLADSASVQIQIKRVAVGGAITNAGSAVYDVVALNTWEYYALPVSGRLNYNVWEVIIKPMVRLNYRISISSMVLK